MSKINTLPSGLQEFLGNTSQGVNPSELSNTVIPTFDIADYYKVDRISVIRIATNYVTTYNNGFFTVPNGELWMLVGVSATVNILATEEAQLTILAAQPGGVNREAIAQSPYRVAGATGETVVAHAVLPRGYMLSSGSQLFATAFMLNVAALRGGEFIMRFVRYKT